MNEDVSLFRLMVGEITARVTLIDTVMGEWILFDECIHEPQRRYLRDPARHSARCCFRS